MTDNLPLSEIAASYALWTERFDERWSQEEFDALTFDERLELLALVWGNEEPED